MGLKAQGVCAGPAVVVVVGGMWGGPGWGALLAIGQETSPTG